MAWRYAEATYELWERSGRVLDAKWDQGCVIHFATMAMTDGNFEPQLAVAERNCLDRLSARRENTGTSE
jgi:hypothetical protein